MPIVKVTSTFHDSVNESLGMKRVDQATGTRIDADGYMELNLADLNTHAMKFRLAVVCVQGNTKNAYVAMTETFDPP